MRWCLVLCVTAFGCAARSGAPGAGTGGAAGTGAGISGGAGTGPGAGGSGFAGTAVISTGCAIDGPSAVRPADEPVVSGDVSFLEPLAYKMVNMIGIALGDVDGDGSLDVAVNPIPAVAMPPPDGGLPPSNRVSAILLNDGKGAFRPSEMDAVPDGPGALRLVDVTGDGSPDLVAFRPKDVGASLVIVANEGGGRFGARRTFDTGKGTNQSYDMNAMALGDLDGDGLNDVAVVGTDAAYVMLNQGGGLFAAPVQVATPAYAQTVFIADIDGDGRGELVFPVAQQLHFFARETGGTFRARTTVDLDGTQVVVASADLDRDGDVDLVVSANRVGVLLNRGDGTFTTARWYVPDETATFCDRVLVQIADFDADGAADLAINTAFAGVRFFMGAGDGTFRLSPRWLAGERYGPIAIGDLNGDGRADVIARAQPQGTDVTGVVKVFLSRAP